MHNEDIDPEVGICPSRHHWDAHVPCWSTGFDSWVQQQTPVSCRPWKAVVMAQVATCQLPTPGFDWPCPCWPLESESTAESSPFSLWLSIFPK